MAVRHPIVRAPAPSPGGQAPRRGVQHVRVKLTRDFCVIANAMTQSCGLSPSALGLAAYISSMPDDAAIGIKPLSERFRVSQQEVAEGLRELVFAGLLARDRANLADGKLRTITSFTGVPGGTGAAPTELAHELAHKGVRYTETHRRRLKEVLACRAAARQRALAGAAETDGVAGRAGTGPPAAPVSSAAGRAGRPGPARIPARVTAPASDMSGDEPASPRPATGPARLTVQHPNAPADRLATPTSGADAPMVIAGSIEARPTPRQEPAARSRSPYVRPVNPPVPDTISPLGDALAGLLPPRPAHPEPPVRPEPPTRPPAAPTDPARMRTWATAHTCERPAVPREFGDAHQLLAGLRRVDPRLVLGARDIAQLAPALAAWLTAGIHPEDITAILTCGLPRGEISRPAGLLARRIGGGMPPPLTTTAATAETARDTTGAHAPPTPRRPLPFANCTCCDRAIRAHRDMLCPDCTTTGCRPTGDTGSNVRCPNRPQARVDATPRPRRWGWQPPTRE